MEEHQAHHANELAHRDRRVGGLPPLLFQHGFEDLELGVGGGTEQHDQQIELQLHQPAVEADPVGQPQREDDQHHHREQDEGQAQPHAVADEPAQRPRVAQVEDFRHEPGEDLPGTHGGQGEQHLGQAQQHRVGGKLFHRQVADDEKECTDPGDGGQGLAHQEVFHAGGNTPGTIGVVIGVFRHGRQGRSRKGR